MTAIAPKVPTMYAGGRRYQKALIAAQAEQRRRSMEAKIARRVKAAQERREKRDYWKKRIGKELGVNMERVVLNSAVTNKRVRPEYVVRATKGRYA